MIKLIIPTLILLLTAAPHAHPRTLTVDDDGPADFDNIQAAIDDANDGDEIIVADGTYTGEGSRDIDFLGKAITVKSENGLDNCIIDCEGTQEENHRGFYFHNGEDANSIVDGFTITNGYAPEEIIQQFGKFFKLQVGGVIFCVDASPTIFNCTMSANVAKCGGVMYCGGASNPTIANCTISANSAVGGGAIESVESSFKIINCDITNNSARVGGAILASNSNCLITNCTFTGNSAEDGGSIYCDYSNVTITDCNISGNLAEDGGAGIYCSGYGRNGTYPVIKNCTITGNMAVRHGGAIFCWESSPTIADCTISGNSAELCAGAIACLESSPRIINCTISGNSAEDGGAIYCQDHSNPTITNCSITSNLATRDGGAMYNFNSSPILTNCTFTGNSAIQAGGMFNLMNSSPMLTNCTFSGNQATNGNALACDSYAQKYPSDLELTNCILWDGGDEIWNNDNSTITIDYSDVHGGWAGEGNIDADPCFVEQGYWDVNGVWVEGDYRLLAGSPCIDAGDPNYIGGPNETDLDGNPRILDGDEDGLALVDMGAYEFWPPVEAEMTLTPHALSCASKGRWVKAHIVLPEGYLPEDVDISTPAVALPMDVESEYIKVFANGKGPVSVEIRFDRTAFCDALTEIGEIEVTVYGSLTTGQYFYATDTIKIKPNPRPIIRKLLKIGLNKPHSGKLR